MRHRVPKIQIGNRFISEGLFYKNQRQDPATGCWEWTGVHNSIGYPFIGYWSEDHPRGAMMTAHRIALALKLGRDIAPGMNANHICHNRNCVNPDHLEEGTQQEKLAAMVRDGNHSCTGLHTRRHGPRKQKRSYKYSEAEITWIRDAEPREIAARYNTTIGRAASMRSMMRQGFRWLPWIPKS